MFDKRKDPRKKLMAFTPVYILKPKKLIGYLEDLTTHGARVVGDVPLEADTLVTLVIDFPKTPPAYHLNHSPSKPGWQEPVEDEARYENLGFQFVDATEAQIAVIEAVIQRYEFKRDV